MYNVGTEVGTDPSPAELKQNCLNLHSRINKNMPHDNPPPPSPANSNNHRIHLPREKFLDPFLLTLIKTLVYDHVHELFQCLFISIKLTLISIHN